MLFKNKGISFLFASFFVLSACASQPEDLESQRVSLLQYKEFDCKQLEIEDMGVTTQANDLYASLKKKADNDAIQTGIGLVLFWPSLFLLEGGDGMEAQEYQRLKGEKEAIAQSSKLKDCNFVPATLTTE